MVFFSYRNELLKLALPLVCVHGFTREALSRSVLALPNPHSEPLQDTAVSALFGDGDNARRTLISAWLDQGRQYMRVSTIPSQPSASTSMNLKEVLGKRLRYNEPVLDLLPEVSCHMSSCVLCCKLLFP